MAERDEQLVGFTSLDDIYPTIRIDDNLTSISTTHALSANQGKVLKDLIDDIEPGTTVTWNGRLSTGYVIGRLYLNGTSNILYIPSPTWSGNYDSSNGVSLGTLGVNGSSVTIYAPDSSTGGESYTLPIATATTLGGVRLGYSSSGNNHAISADSSGNLYLDGVLYEGSVVTSSNNFDNLTDEGIYLFSGGGIPSNGPSDFPSGTGGLIEVNSNGTLTTQRVTSVFGDGTWIRVRNTSGWVNSWTQIAGSGSGSTSGSTVTVTPNYSSGTSLATINVDGSNSYIYLPAATSSAYGGIQIGYTSTTNNRAVLLSSGKAYVNVPTATSSAVGLMRATISGSGNAVTGASFSSGVLTLTMGTIESGGSTITDYVSTTTTSAQTIQSSLTATAFYESSDAQLKDNVREVDVNDDDALSVEYYTFNWKKDGKKAHGVIAQEVEDVIPELVVTNEDGYKAIDYTMLHSLQINALMNKIKELEAKIVELSNK